MTKPIIQLDHSAKKPKTLVDRVISDIRQYMRDKNLKPGDALPAENALALQFGVSRTITREAFRALAALRILEVGNGRKARVASPDAAAFSMILDHTVHTRQLSFQQVLDVRRTLEQRTASLAALRRSDDEAGELLNIVKQMYTLMERPDELMELDILFHETIAKASGNSLYSIIIDSFRVITHQTWHISWNSRATLENRQENIRCHERIAEAIKAQDSVRAEVAISEHFDSAVAALLHAGIT